MRIIALSIAALLLASCGATDNSGQSNVTIVGNGTEPCAKKECLSPSDVKDKR